MSNNGKIYYFKVTELALLLAAGGLESFYGIKMNIDNLDKKNIYETMFELQKKGMLIGDGQKLSISEEISGIIDDIRTSKAMLVYLSWTPQYPQRFVYIGSRAVIIAPFGVAGDILQLEDIEVSILKDRICNEWFMLEQAVSDEMLYIESSIDNKDMQENANRLLETDINCISEDQWKYAHFCIRLINIMDFGCIRQYLLMQKGLNDYIAVSNNEDTRIYAYSVKRLSEIINEDLGGLE